MSSNPKQALQRERFTMLEPKEPNNLTETQKKLPVAEGTQRERFTMLEPKEPNNLTETQKKLPVVVDREPPPEVGESDLVAIRGLLGRLGAVRLHQIVDSLAAPEPD